jgi:hypothetical protein
VKRKFKVIKENKKEEDSLFGKAKSQAAMEYLMTYGWAILIIALTLVVLYSLGIMNPKNFLPRSPPGSCFVFRPNGPGTTDFISLQGTCGYLPMYVGSFNGVNSYVNLPIINIPYITVEAWVKHYTPIPNNNPRIVCNGNPGTTNRGFYIGIMSGGNLYFGIGNGTANSFNPTSYYPPANMFYQVVMTFDGAKNRLYVNGNLIKEVAISGTIATTTL